MSTKCGSSRCGTARRDGIRLVLAGRSPHCSRCSEGLMDHHQFSQMITYLSAAYGMEVSKKRAAVYWDQLGSLQADLLMEAAKAHVNHSRHFPTVAELRQCYREAMARRAPGPERRLRAYRPADREKAREMIRQVRAAIRR